MVLLLPYLLIGVVATASPVQIVTENYHALTEPPQVKMACRIVVANSGRETLRFIRIQALFFTPGQVLSVEQETFYGPIYPDEVREWEFVTDFNHYTTDEVELRTSTWAQVDTIGGYI